MARKNRTQSWSRIDKDGKECSWVEELAKKGVGYVFRLAVSAPGIGYHEYKIVRVSKEAIEVECISSTAREMTIAECV